MPQDYTGSGYDPVEAARRARAQQRQQAAQQAKRAPRVNSKALNLHETDREQGSRFTRITYGISSSEDKDLDGDLTVTYWPEKNDVHVDFLGLGDIYHGVDLNSPEYNNSLGVRGLLDLMRPVIHNEFPGAETISAELVNSATKYNSGRDEDFQIEIPFRWRGEEAQQRGQQQRLFPKSVGRDPEAAARAEFQRHDERYRERTQAYKDDLQRAEMERHQQQLFPKDDYSKWNTNYPLNLNREHEAQIAYENIMREQREQDRQANEQAIVGNMARELDQFMNRINSQNADPWNPYADDSDFDNDAEAEAWNENDYYDESDYTGEGQGNPFASQDILQGLIDIAPRGFQQAPPLGQIGGFQVTPGPIMGPGGFSIAPQLQQIPGFQGAPPLGQIHGRVPQSLLEYILGA